MNDIVALPLASPHMIAEVEGPIGWMIFNKPERRNAVSLDMWEEIPRILHHFETDPSVRVIVLKGAGERSFVSGADISQFEKARSSEESNAHYERVTELANNALADCSKPTIAMIRGYCIGGGLGIAIGCDIRIASEESTFGIPAARLGVGYGAPGVKKLVGLVGPAFTKEIFYTARHFSAAEALTMGLVNRMVSGAELDGQIRSYCATIAGNAPKTISTLKCTVKEVLRGNEANWGLCERMVSDCFASQDYVEGRRAFMEKRPPIFRGE